jgi:hypothetical protein
MSLVNSFINQIGREMGRDAYRSFPSGNRTRQPIHLQEEESLIAQVKAFELLEDHQATLRLLTNIVEKAEHVNPEDFEWQELFCEIDNKIDFCKDNLPVEFKDQLNRLDEVNAANYQNMMARHAAYVETVIQFYENKANELNAKGNAIVYLAAFFGLRAMYMKEYRVNALVNVLFVALLFIMSFLGYLTYVDPIHHAGNLPTDTPEHIQKIANLGVGIMSISAILYCLQLVLAFRKIYAFKKTIHENNAAKDKFVNYKNQLLKG